MRIKEGRKERKTLERKCPKIKGEREKVMSDDCLFKWRRHKKVFHGQPSPVNIKLLSASTAEVVERFREERQQGNL